MQAVTNASADALRIGRQRAEVVGRVAGHKVGYVLANAAAEAAIEASVNKTIGSACREAMVAAMQAAETAGTEVGKSPEAGKEAKELVSEGDFVKICTEHILSGTEIQRAEADAYSKAQQATVTFAVNEATKAAVAAADAQTKATVEREGPPLVRTAGFQAAWAAQRAMLRAKEKIAKKAQEAADKVALPVAKVTASFVAGEETIDAVKEAARATVWEPLNKEILKVAAKTAEESARTVAQEEVRGAVAQSSATVLTPIIDVRLRDVAQAAAHLVSGNAAVMGAEAALQAVAANTTAGLPHLAAGAPAAAAPAPR